MEDYYMNITSQNYSYDDYYDYLDNYDYVYHDHYYDYGDYYDFFDFHDNNDHSNNTANFDIEGALSVWTWIVISLGLPLNLMAIYSLLSLVRNDHVAPIYVINVLISDILQFCCLILQVAGLKDEDIKKIFATIYNCSLKTGVVFMVCISLQRYLLIVHPVWYRCRRTIKTSVVVCVLVWVLTATLQTFTEYFNDRYFKIIFKNVFFLLPFPLLIFFLAATLKALSASISVPSDEKRRIVGMLVLVLLIYTLLFLPHIIFLNIKRPSPHFQFFSKMFLRLTPLVDLLLYIFLRQGTVNNLCSSSACCRRIQGNDISSSVITMTTRPQSASRRQ